MSDYISDEIVIEILKRLSIEDAGRCIAVCKSWYSIISSPSFISVHSQHIAAASNYKSLVFIRNRFNTPIPRERYSLRFDDEGFEEHKSFAFPLTSDSHSFLDIFSIVGCVNGVVCLSKGTNTYTDVIVLWNPSIRKYVRLPKPVFSAPSHDISVCNVGFGFDAVNNDFKVVRVAYLDREFIQRKVVPRVEVYESRIGSWRSVDAKGYPFIIDNCSPQAFLDGNVHWVIGSEGNYNNINSEAWLIGSKNQFKNLNARRSTNLIVALNLTSEVFMVMNVPDSISENPPLDDPFDEDENSSRRDFRVSVLGQLLSLIHSSCSGNVQSCCIWVMKQYGEPDSWTKLFNVGVTPIIWGLYGFRRNGEVLVKTHLSYYGISYAQGLISFEPKSKRVIHLMAIGDWSTFYVDNFVESLALIGVKGDVTNKLADEPAPFSNGYPFGIRPAESTDHSINSSGSFTLSCNVVVQLFS